MKPRIRNLKSPYFVEVRLTKNELQFIANQCGVTITFYDKMYTIPTEQISKFEHAAGMMLAQGAHCWNRG